MKIEATLQSGDGPQTFRLTGRTAWALKELVKAGALGVTPLDHPAPRWSSYVEKLRKRGIAVETIREEHGGRFPGRHGRYVLACDVHVKEGAA